MVACNNCTFAVETNGRGEPKNRHYNYDEQGKLIRDVHGPILTYYCDYCVEMIRKQRIREYRGIIPDEDKNSGEIVTKLEAENQKLKEELERERKTFEEALDKAEEWHTRQLGERDKELAERNERISQLEHLLKDKQIAELRRDINELQKLVTNLTVNATSESERVISQVQVPPKE